jgi:hypothetical protein
MAFVKTKSKPRPGRNGSVEVTMGAYLAGDKGVARKSVVIRIGVPTLTQLGWHTEPQTLVSVMEGTDTDVGFLQLVPDEAGYAVTGTKSKTGQSRSVTVPIDRFNHYILNEAPVPSAPVE